MVFTTYAATIPRDLRESVEIDGGNFSTYFFRVLLPLSRTPFAVYASISLPVIWNDLLNGFLFLSPDKSTVIPLVNAFTGTFATNLQATYSGLLFATVPLLVVYLVFQRLFVRSALAGAIKKQALGFIQDIKSGRPTKKQGGDCDGRSQGIGATCAELFVGEGAAVAVWDVNTAGALAAGRTSWLSAVQTPSPAPAM